MASQYSFMVTMNTWTWVKKMNGDLDTITKKYNQNTLNSS